MPSIPILTTKVANQPNKQNQRQEVNQPGDTLKRKGSMTAVNAPVKTKQQAAQGSQSSALEYIQQSGRWLVDIPLSVLSEHSSWIYTGNWQGGFDCALWLRTPAGLPHPLHLVLKYIDSSGEKILQIDRCQTGSHRTVLLNGSITLSVAGRVRDMGLYLLGAHDTIVAVEEWHITPQQRRGR